MAITKVSDLIEYFNDKAVKIIRSDQKIKEVINVNLNIGCYAYKYLMSYDEHIIFVELNPLLMMFLKQIKDLKDEFKDLYQKILKKGFWFLSVGTLYNADECDT